MANERITEDIVRNHFKNDPLFKSNKEQKAEITNLQELIDWIDSSKTCYVTEKGENYFVVQAPKNATWQIQFEKKDDIEDIIYKAKEIGRAHV